MAEHTPGPWRAVEDKDGDWRVMDANGSMLLATIHEDRARLIAAAPDLLEAARKLEMVVRLGIPQRAVPLIAEHGLWDEFVEARIRIEEAINKAEGRE